MIKAVIFDLDGVLVDAREWHYEAFNRALAQFGFAVPHEEHLKLFDGLPTRRKLELMTEREGLSVDLYDRIFELKQKLTMEAIESRCRPDPRHEDALRRLKATGYRLAVASNSSRRTVETVLEKTRLMPYLEFAFSNDDVARTKPHPEIYFKAMARLGLAPEECLIVEDNINGIRAAEASGGRLMAVTGVGDVHIGAILDRIGDIDKR